MPATSSIRSDVNVASNISMPEFLCMFVSLNPILHASLMFWGGNIKLWRWGEGVRGRSHPVIQEWRNWMVHNQQLRVYIQRAKRIIPSSLRAHSVQTHPFSRWKKLRVGEEKELESCISLMAEPTLDLPPAYFESVTGPPTPVHYATEESVYHFLRELSYHCQD